MKFSIERDSDKFLNGVLTVIVEPNRFNFPIGIELLSLDLTLVVVTARFKFFKRSQGTVKLALGSTVGGNSSHVGTREAQAQKTDGVAGKVSA